MGAIGGRGGGGRGGAEVTSERGRRRAGADVGGGEEEGGRPCACGSRGRRVSEFAEEPEDESFNVVVLFEVSVTTICGIIFVVQCV